MEKVGVINIRSWWLRRIEGGEECLSVEFLRRGLWRVPLLNWYTSPGVLAYECAHDTTVLVGKLATLFLYRYRPPSFVTLFGFEIGWLTFVNYCVVSSVRECECECEFTFYFTKGVIYIQFLVSVYYFS